MAYVGNDLKFKSKFTLPGSMGWLVGRKIEMDLSELDGNSRRNRDFVNEVKFSISDAAEN